MNRTFQRRHHGPPQISEYSQRWWNCFGHTLRAFHFILNAFCWVISILAIVGGFIVGFSTNTVVLPLYVLDFMATTPVILFVEYGLITVFVASIGCFVGSGADSFIILMYIIVAIALVIFDLAFGICLYFWPNALTIYMVEIQKSMKGYGVELADSVGIYPLPPKVYWDHIQLRGKCCGAFIWSEWANTPIGNSNSFPFSCCNDEYRYSECGEQIWGPEFHPFNEHHDIPDMVFQKGCFAKLPIAFVNAFKETGYVGVILGAFLIFGILMAIVLFCLICTRRYRPDELGIRKTENSPEPIYHITHRRNTVISEHDIQENRKHSFPVGSKSYLQGQHKSAMSESEIPQHSRAARTSRTYSQDGWLNDRN